MLLKTTEMSKITRTRYVLAVQDLDASVRFYTQQLGCRILFQFPGWCYLGRDALVLMLGECADEPPASDLGDHSYMAYLEVEDIESLYREFQQKEVKIRKSLRTEDWGMKEFAIQTPDGHRLMFGEEVPAKT